MSDVIKSIIKSVFTLLLSPLFVIGVVLFAGGAFTMWLYLWADDFETSVPMAFFIGLLGEIGWIVFLAWASNGMSIWAK